MVALQTLASSIHILLQVDQFQDYCPNGLQVEGKSEIKRIVSGVTACQALIDAAIVAQADAILVHHGYFWKGEDPCITGMKKRRLQQLLQHDISLLAYHLPLDAHPELGNNAQLAARLKLRTLGRFGNGQGPDIGLHGELPEALPASRFNELLGSSLGRAAQWIDAGKAEIKTLAWCTGGAQSYIDAAVTLGVDAFVTGEISEPTVHVAREMGIHFFAAGHHATERYGIQALGEYLAQQFQLQHEFIDIDNPV